ncbi:MAG TPA: serine hydrolase domain-containing protein [Pirellulales bacterium]|nr:serine hydrolase domain-containing protein [Pirellulales bacterium]
MFTRARLAALLVALLGVHRALSAAEPASVADVLQPYVDRHALAGAVTAVATKDKVLRVDTVGYADIAAGRAMTPDTVFWIASQSKPITATALMMLVDEGKVNLDDPVEKHLPEFAGQWLIAEKDAAHELLKKPGHPITVRNVLSHTSGLPFKSGIEQPTLDLWPLRARVLSYAITPLEFDPDHDYKYSNAGINTAGRIIEVVSGMPYENFLDERLFRPLGMKDTTFWPSGEQLKRLAKAYKPNQTKDGLQETPIAQLQYPLDDRSRQPMPAGGLFATAHDLVRFYQMLAGGGSLDGKKYLSPKAVDALTHRQTPEGLKESYGLGFKVEAAQANFGHGGAYGTNSTYDRETGLITIYLIQHEGFLVDGKEALAAFKRAAAERFAPTK